MLKSVIRAMRVSSVAIMCVAAPVALSAETLRDALIGAYNHSGLLDQNRALLRAADEDVAQAVAALRPIITWSASVTRSATDTVSSQNTAVTINSANTQSSVAVQLSLLLWDNNRSQLGVEAARESVLATRQGLISIEQQIFLRAVAAYFTVRRETENVALRQNNLRLIREELRAAQDRFDVGEVTRTDVAQAQARLAQANSELALSMGQLVQAQEEYANVVGRKPGRLAAPGRLPRVESSVKRAKQIAVQNHPDLRQVQHLVKSADISVDIASRLAYPTVNATASLSHNNTEDSRAYTSNGSIGLSASGPIYQGGALTSQRRAAQANRDAQRGNLHRVRHDIRQGVGNAYAQLQVAQAQLEATEQQIRAAQIAFRGVREEATLGARTTLDVLDAEQALLDAQAAKISAQADRQIAAYQVLSSLGRLTATALDLGIQQYDPDAYYNLARRAPVAKSKQGQQLDKIIRSLQLD